MNGMQVNMLSASGAMMLPALTGVASSCVFPAAQHAMRVFARSGSFMSLTAPKPAQEQPKSATPSGAQDSSFNTAFTWTFVPLARELTRTAGGFEHRARWPLQNGSSLLDMQLNGSASARHVGGSSSSSFSFASSFGRHYSSLPEPSQPVQPQQSHEYTSAAAAQLPTELEQPAAPGMLAMWFPKAQPRLKGFSRKLVLRQVNRKIIARVARRFTIGIPVLGVCLLWCDRLHSNTYTCICMLAGVQHARLHSSIYSTKCMLE